MNTLTINNKKYIVVEEKEFEQLQIKAALKATPAKKLTLSQGKKLAYKLIDKWSKEK